MSTQAILGGNEQKNEEKLCTNDLRCWATSCCTTEPIPCMEIKAPCVFSKEWTWESQEDSCWVFAEQNPVGQLGEVVSTNGKTSGIWKYLFSLDANFTTINQRPTSCLLFLSFFLFLKLASRSQVILKQVLYDVNGRMKNGLEIECFFREHLLDKKYECSPRYEKRII